jgi:hypothetical protein
MLQAVVPSGEAIQLRSAEAARPVGVMVEADAVYRRVEAAAGACRRSDDLEFDGRECYLPGACCGLVSMR